MGGYKAASNIDDLVKKRDWAMDGRARRGLPTTSQIPMSHKLIRDERGRKLVVNEDLRHLWNDLATLILEGVAWREMENELYSRYSYAAPDSKPYQRRKFHKLVMTPTFWGHSARRYRGAGYRSEKRGVRRAGKWHTGLWAIEPGHEVPDGVLIYYDAHEAVYTGELAERIKVELRRRDEVVRGKTRPHTRYWYAGLFICGRCGYAMNTLVSGSGWIGLRCTSRYHTSPARPTCTNTKMISEKAAREYVDAKLREMLDRGDPEWVMSVESQERHDVHSQLNTLEREMARLQEHVRTLIRNEAQAGEEVRHIYTEEIAKTNEELKALRKRATALQAQSLAQDNSARAASFEELARLSVDALWKQDAQYINRLLHTLMGKRRFVVQAGVIVGVVDAPKHIGRMGV